MGTSHVSCDFLHNVFQCSVGKHSGLKRGKVPLSSVVSESMEVEGIAQHDVSGMQQGIL